MDMAQDQRREVADKRQRTKYAPEAIDLHQDMRKLYPNLCGSELPPSILKKNVYYCICRKSQVRPSFCACTAVVGQVRALLQELPKRAGLAERSFPAPESVTTFQGVKRGSEVPWLGVRNLTSLIPRP